MWLAGLDLGATYIKAARLDLDSLRVREAVRAAFPGFVPGLPPLHREVEIGPILKVVRELLDAMASRTTRRCAGLAVCGQMHGLVLTDKRGRPMSRFISWQDNRTLEPRAGRGKTWFDGVAARISPQERRRLGNELRPASPLCILARMCKERVLPARAIPASLPDFVAASLCGEAPTTEATHASAHGAYDLEHGTWYAALLERLDLGGLSWPALRRCGDVVGRLPIGGAMVPCYTPVGDQQCSLLGTFLEQGELSINIATGSQVTMRGAGAPDGDYQTRPYFDGTKIRTVTHIPAGRSLCALVRLLCELHGLPDGGEDEAWRQIAQAVEEVPATDLRVGLSIFAGARGDRGQIMNIREDNLSVGHLFRAAFEDMAEGYHACALRISPRGGWRRLAFSGGLVRKLAPLRECISRRFGDPWRLSPAPDESLLGLLVLSLVFSGRAASAQEATSAVRQGFSQ